MTLAVGVASQKHGCERLLLFHVKVAATVTDWTTIGLGIDTLIASILVVHLISMLSSFI